MTYYQGPFEPIYDLIPAYIKNHMSSKMYDVIIRPFPTVVTLKFMFQ